MLTASLGKAPQRSGTCSSIATKENYVVYQHSLEEITWIFTTSPRISPLLHTHTLWSAMPPSVPPVSELDRCETFQHLTTQFLNLYLTSAINMHWDLGQIYLLHYFLKVVQNSALKSSHVKGNWNQPAKGNSLKLGMQFQYTNVILAETAPQLPSETSYHPPKNSSRKSHA